MTVVVKPKPEGSWVTADTRVTLQAYVRLSKDFAAMIKQNKLGTRYS